MPSLSENAWKDLKLFRDCRSRSINRKTIFHGVSTKFLNRAEPRRACQYRLLFSPKYRAKPGPIGPDQDLIRAVVDMKQRIRLRTAEDLPGSLFIGHAKDSLHSIDLFRCESVGFADFLGTGRYGPVHSAHHRVWCSAGHRESCRSVPDVQSSDPRNSFTEVSHLRPSSPVSIPSMAIEPESPRRDRNQNGIVRSPCLIRSLNKANCFGTAVHVC